MQAITISGLDTGFFVSANDIVIWPQVLAIPDALIKIQNLRCLFAEVGITREDPASVLPWLYGVGIEPSPNRRTTDRSNDAIFNDLSGNICVADSRQW
jgi:hypothetical protein